MKQFKSLSRAEMKKVAGGGNLSTCSAVCSCPAGFITKPGGFNISLTCDGICIAVDNLSVNCGIQKRECNNYDEINAHCELAS